MIGVVSRDALWSDPAEPCKAVPAVPQDTRRHLHKAAPVLAVSHGRACETDGHTPGCSTSRAATQISTLDVLSLLSDQPVCGTEMTF